MLRPGVIDVSIGRPIDNTQVFIVNAALQPQPAGIPGELLIGGDGLADGYHDRGDLTADRFISDLPSSISHLSPRLYRMHSCATRRIRRHCWSNGGNTVSGRHVFKRCRLFFMYAVSHGLLLPIQRIRRCYIVPSW